MKSTFCISKRSSRRAATSKGLLCALLSLLLITGVKAQVLLSTSQIEINHQRLIAKVDTAGNTSEQLSAVLSATTSTINDLKQLTEKIEHLNDVMSSQLQSDKVLSVEFDNLKSAYPAPNKRADSAAIKSRFLQYQRERDSVLTSLSSMRDESSELDIRSNTISTDLALAREAANQSTSSNSVSKVANNNLDEARTVFNQATNKRNSLRVSLLEKELSTLPLRQALLDQRLKLANEKLAVLTRSIDIIQSQLRKSDLLDAQQLESAIQKRIDNGLESDTVYAKENLKLAQELTALTNSYYSEESLVQTTANQINDIDKSLSLLERIISAGRADGDLGSVLRRIRSELVSPVQLSREIKRVQSKQIELQLNDILWQDAKDVLEIAKTRDEEAAGTASLSAERYQILGLLISTATKLDNNLNSRLVNLDSLQSRVKQLRRGLNGRLLWLPTNNALNSAWLSQTYNAALKFITPGKWRGALRDLKVGFKQSPLLSILLYLTAASLLLFRKRILVSLKELPQRVRNVNLDTHWVSPYAFTLSIALALALPLILWTSSWLLEGSDDAFAHTIGVACKTTGDVWFIFALFANLARPKGLIDSHFGWGEESRQTLSSNLSWLMLAIVPATFVFDYSMTIGDDQSQYGLGRTVFLIISLALSIAGFRILKQGSHVVDHMFGHLRTTLIAKVAFFIFAIIPLILGLLTLVGYFDTSVILQSKLFLSGLLILCAILAYGFMHRAHEVSSRRDAWERAKARRKARLEKTSQDPEHEDHGDLLANFEAEEFESLNDVNKQAKTAIWLITITIIAVGFYFLWRSILPALDVADSIVLWQGVKIVDGVSVAQGVTLENFISAVILIFGGFFLSNNLRGILALGISQKIKMRPGTEYAATTILGYVFVASGVVIGLSQLGLDWSKLQWIVAAMGVGLGFGLQEIVANFVSGLIILFERPIRVGDIVTIGSLDGVVTKISIRATTIKDFDKRDVLIPNKQIITDNVSNWTLQDSVTRLLIKIGVGYETDIGLAKELMMKVIDNHPDVLKEPNSSVYFLNHGDSTLDFEIRAYVSDISKRLPTTHAINEQIHHALVDAGINMAFPQRDIHIISHVEAD